MPFNQLPRIIQGGMGVAVSNWRLAQSVSKLGQLGVVSGTGLVIVITRLLQNGDPGGHVRRALEHLPLPGIARRLLDAYFIEGGKSPDAPYKPLPMATIEGSEAFQEQCIAANFVEVFLAREGHSNPVGINYLEKIQLPHLPSIYGAMLAGVAFIIMGAGIPKEIPGVLDAFVNHQPASYPVRVAGAQAGEDCRAHFDPRSYTDKELPPLLRPEFVPIVAADTLAMMLRAKSNGKVNGFVVEGPLAGGHNAPPRGTLRLTDDGEPIYGERDVVNLKVMRDLGLPFWLAGGYGTSERLREALDLGAAGVQVGTPFALCVESALAPHLKQALIQKALSGQARVFTDPRGSPTGFPFKVALLDGTLSEASVYGERNRVCDLGYLREAYRREDGSVGLRCPAEPEAAFVGKGGDPEAMVGRKCLCNALLANVGLPQRAACGSSEPPLVTLGDALSDIGRFCRGGNTDFTAEDVIRTLLAGVESAS